MKYADFFKQVADPRALESAMEQSALQPHFQAIFYAYRKALGDPRTVIPTPLHLAIANAQRCVDEMHEGQDEHKTILGADALVREAV